MATENKKKLSMKQIENLVFGGGGINRELNVQLTI